MKIKALACSILAVLMVMTGCNTTNLGKGTAGAGAAVGAIIGKHMDKQQKKLEENLKNPEVEIEKAEINGLQAIRVTFPGGILFATGKSDIQPSAQTELSEFAKSLEQNPLTNVEIGGYTDNTGSIEANTRVADSRAKSVKNLLEAKGIAASRIEAKGYPMQNYVANNDTPEGQAKNRRVEIYILASPEMVKAAENGEI